MRLLSSQWIVRKEEFNRLRNQRRNKFIKWATLNTIQNKKEVFKTLFNRKMDIFDVI